MGVRNSQALLISLVALCLDASAFEPQVNYMLQCMGCHAPDGRGEPGHVPSVKASLLPFARMTTGRSYLVQVPGLRSRLFRMLSLHNCSIG